MSAQNSLPNARLVFTEDEADTGDSSRLSGKYMSFCVPFCRPFCKTDSLKERLNTFLQCCSNAYDWVCF